MTRRRRSSGVIAVLVALALQLLPASGAAAASPASMAATGDSITRAFNTCLFPFTDCPQNSWSTGTSTTVNSHARRLGITGSAFNDAVSGARMADLASQMGSVVSHGVPIDYVTVLMGANDVCTGSVGSMTGVTDFAAQLRSGLDVLASSGHGQSAVVYVVSAPNVYRLWEILHTDSNAVSAWNRWGICQSLLANATSLDPGDEARRREVRKRNLELDVVLRDVCAEYAALKTLDCRTDSYTGFRYDFVPTEVSTRDYFHPSVGGQSSIAKLTWNVGPYGTATGSTAPVAHFTLGCSGLTCTFDASGSVDPNGSVTSYAWTFGDGATATGASVSHTYPAGATYTVELTVTDDSGLTDTDAGTFTISGSATNDPPTASFTASCADLSCGFDGSGSTDPDGTIFGYAWDFGDDTTGSGASVSHTYTAAGTYTVTLTVTDDDGATATQSQSVTVGTGGVTLSVTGYKVRGVQHADLSWSGATSTNIDVYRDGVMITTTANDGTYTDQIGGRGGGSYTYKVCEQGTEVCSNEATVSF